MARVEDHSRVPLLKPDPVCPCASCSANRYELRRAAEAGAVGLSEFDKALLDIDSPPAPAPFRTTDDIIKDIMASNDVPPSHSINCACESCMDYYEKKGRKLSEDAEFQRAKKDAIAATGDYVKPQKSRVTKGDAFARKVAEILGLQPNSVMGLTFKLHVGKPATVTVECYLSSDQEGHIVSAMEEHQLMPYSGSGEFVYEDNYEDNSFEEI